MKAVLLACALLVAAPGYAAADVIFDQADADELASVLAEAYTDQGVCYGWDVTVDNVGVREESTGSNFGAGKPVTSGSCRAWVEFTATITYTSESSESEDSASYDVRSDPPAVSSADLNSLEIDFGALTGENPDAVVGKAVTALPLLAADKGIARPLSATPDTATTPADAQLTDSPGSDWWRDRGGMVIWALILMAASGVLIWAVLRTNRRRARTVPARPVPETPNQWVPPTEPTPTKPADSEPPTPEPPAAEPPPSEPPPSEPAATEPAAVESPPGEPSATEPAATESPPAEPPATELAVESPVADPATTDSATTDSVAAEAATTEPGEAAPPATEEAVEESAASEAAAPPSESTVDGAGQARPAPPDQKDKE